jgi:hypothetical protein
MTRPTACALLALLGLHAPSAWAAKGAEVAVVGVHVSGLDDAEAVDAADAIAAAVDRTSTLAAVSPGTVRGRIAGREELVVADSFLAPGRSALDEGRVLFDRADFEGAIPVLERAVERLTDGLRVVTESKDLIDALILLGVAQTSVGETDAARETFRQVVVFDHNRELDSVNFPPKMVNLFKEVRTEVLSAPSARLTVEGEEGSILYVNGIGRGPLPAVVDELPPGDHTVLVVGTGGSRSFDTVTLIAGQKAIHTADKGERYLGIQSGTEVERARQTGLLYQALGKHVATPLVLVGGQTSDGYVGLQLYEPRTGNFSKLVTAESGSDPIGSLVELVPIVAGYINDTGTLRTDRVSPAVAALNVGDNSLLVSLLLDPEPIVGTVTVTRGPPWYLWAGIGAVAAGGAAGTALLVTRDGPETVENNGTITVGPMP